MPQAVRDRSCDGNNSTKAQQAQRAFFLTFFVWLFDNVAALTAHVHSNASNPWFCSRVVCLADHVIISTNWLFKQFLDWKISLACQEKACARRYATPAGEQKSLTNFMRQRLLHNVDGVQRIKGQDSSDGDSEYFIVLPGGLKVLQNETDRMVDAGTTQPGRICSEL